MNIFEAYQEMKNGKSVVSKSLDRTRKLFINKDERQFRVYVYSYRGTPLEKVWWHPGPIGVDDMDATDWEVVDE